MEPLSPFPVLEITDPAGQPYKTIPLTEERLTIGRFPAHNDLALEPDPQQLLSRKGHCALEYDAGSWWVVDNGSVNGTFLQHSGEVQMVVGRARLAEGDAIRLLGRWSEQGEPCYWTLVFHDPLGTKPAGTRPGVVALEYDWVQARLFRVDGHSRLEIAGLRPQEHKLIRYMDGRNRTNGYAPVMCTYEELITAIWGEESLHTEVEITHLVYELRQKLELTIQEPLLLQNVRGLGYRLVSRPLTR